MTEQLIKVPGRILPVPTVAYKGEKNAEIRNGGWNMSKHKFNTGARLDSWSFLVILANPGPRNQFRDAAHARPVV